MITKISKMLNGHRGQLAFPAMCGWMQTGLLRTKQRLPEGQSCLCVCLSLNNCRNGQDLTWPLTRARMGTSLFPLVRWRGFEMKTVEEGTLHAEKLLTRNRRANAEFLSFSLRKREKKICSSRSYEIGIWRTEVYLPSPWL